MTSHELLPWHVTLPPLPTEMVHWLVPPHVTLPFVPVESVHVLPPVHVEVQPAPQVPPHCDFPAQLVVHPVPQFTTQSFFDSQLNVTLLGGGTAPPSPEPIEQVPPELHEQVCPLQEQEPLQSSELDDAPPHAEKVGNSSANGASHTRRFTMVRASCNARARREIGACGPGPTSRIDASAPQAGRVSAHATTGTVTAPSAHRFRS